MKQGFNIVIGGRNFQPDLLDYGNRNIPDHIIHRGDRLPQGIISDDSFVEWVCQDEDIQKLDVVWEAIDYLTQHSELFKEAGNAPGVEYRKLNVWVTKRTGFDLEPEHIQTLASLNMEFSIAVLPE